MVHKQYRLIQQIAATAQFVAYRAENARDGQTVRMIELKPAAFDDWDLVERRLLKCSLIRHPNAVQILQANLDASPPCLVTEWKPLQSLESVWSQKRPVCLEAALGLGAILAEVVQQAHRFGVLMEQLSPYQIGVDAQGNLQVELAELIRFAEPTSGRRWYRPEGEFRPRTAFASDVFRTAATLYWLLSGPLPEPDRPLTPADVAGIPPLPDGRVCPPKLKDLLARALDPEPEMRPAAAEFVTRLATISGDGSESGSKHPLGETLLPDEAHHTMADSHVAATRADDAEAGNEVSMPSRLGRFEILDLLGSGGMGNVYRGRDPIDQSLVAIKTLRTNLAANTHSLKRFLKEARMLSEVSNPYVTNLLEINEDNGIHYIVMEYVAGKPVSALLKRGSPLDEGFALQIIACACRALADPHERGIVHRDVKPSNILILGGRTSDAAAPGTTQFDSATDTTAILDLHDQFQVKLSDFGLARHVDQSESLEVTRAGAVVGTPYYMSPEQCTGKQNVDVRSDVYSLGATLFHLLAGRPPYMGDDAVVLAGMHCNDPIPKISQYNDQVSDAVQQIVERAMSKSPDDRYQTAGEMLDDVERVLRGEPTALNLHPILPRSKSGKPVCADFTWQLSANPQQLWPLVANTDRLNHALGLPAVEYQTNLNADKQVERTATARLAGMTIQWREHPFEWIEGRRFGVLREFHNGPFVWFASIVEMSPRVGGGTTLTQRFRIEPRGLVGRTLAKVNFGNKTRRALDLVYSRMDAAAVGSLGAKGADPFTESVQLPPQTLRALDALVDRLLRIERLDREVVRKFHDFLATAPDPQVARIRPIALAEFLGVDGNKLVDVCLHAAHQGLLVLLWDLLCPVCRIASEVKETLRELREHGHCEACNLDFTLDFANSVEMIFQIHPNIRNVERKTYCIGGPAHSPHVLAQVRIAPRETVILELALSEGSYRLRGPQLPYWHDLRVRPGSGETRWDHTFTNKGAGDTPVFRPGKQTLRLSNAFNRELLVRVERVAQRQDALTAARACSNAVFRELYPEEVLTPGQLVNVATVTLLATDVEQGDQLYQTLGDARAFGILHEHFRILDDAIRRENGAMVKTLGQGLLAVFGDPASAVRVALGLQERLRQSPTTKDLLLKVAVHNGTAMAATLNDRLDYFGGTVNSVLRWVAEVPGGKIWLSRAVASDPEVFQLLADHGLHPEIITVEDSVRIHELQVRS